METAAWSLFGDPGQTASLSSERNEQQRLAALARARGALEDMEALGLQCGVFGSALRPGDFFLNSDVDFAAWLPELAAIGQEDALAARLACHRAMGEQPFDLVILPCANLAFGQRILGPWHRGLAEVSRACAGLPMSSPLNFGPLDVAFIDRDRLAIGRRAAARMAAAAASAELCGEGAAPGRLALSLCASMQTLVRIAEKCAKDILREFAKIKPDQGESRPLYPLLAYPCESLGGAPLAGMGSLRLYFSCADMLELPDDPNAQWAHEMALLSTLFAESMASDLEPALARMEAMDSRHG